MYIAVQEAKKGVRKRGQTIVYPHHCRPKQWFLDGNDAVWRIVSGVVYQFGDAITIHVLGVGVQPGRVNGVAHIDASLG
jgi:hypothetical protein